MKRSLARKVWFFFCAAMGSALLLARRIPAFARFDKSFVGGAVFFYFFAGLEMLRALRRFLRGKFKSFLRELIKRVFKFFKALVKQILNRVLPKNGRRFQNGAKDEFSFILPGQEDGILGSKNLPKPPKWRRLRNNRERIRYIYRETVRKYLHRGADIRISMTPDETGRVLEERKDDTEPLFSAGLFEIYDRARYGGEDTVIDDGQVADCLAAAGIRKKM